MNSGFFKGAGRFSRARGVSHFARAFNGELPRFFGSVNFAKPFRCLSELPLGGFAEQGQPLAGVLNAMRLSEEVSDLEENVDVSEVLATALDSLEMSTLKEWSGFSVCCETRRE